MRTLYFDCSSGISGDMTVAALLDLGADRDKLKSVIDDMKLGCELKFGRTSKNAIDAYDFDVVLPEHCHSHNHQNSHSHRTLKDISPVIDNSLLSERAKKLAHKMFEIVAEAESKAHRVPKDEVHFHEVGAVDSIVDICSVAFCLDNLGIDRVMSSPVSEGTGEIECQHGIIPVPVPATLEISRAYSIPLRIKDVNGEMCTPTGAAIVAATVSEFGAPKDIAPSKVGYGAGKKDFPQANILRAYLYEDNNMENKDKYTDEVTVLETNIDDSTPEVLGFCLDKLFEAGVKDAYFTPIYMKKGRPAYSLTVICDNNLAETASKLIFKHTSSTGIRCRKSERTIMMREPIKVETKYGPVSANRFTYKDIEKISLEYESVKKLAEEKGVEIRSIYENYVSAE